MALSIWSGEAPCSQKLLSPRKLTAARDGVEVGMISTAIVLIAHGSRNAAANDDLIALAEKIRDDGRYALVVASFLELAQPDIKTACLECIAMGANRIILSPYFLAAGVHIRRDLAQLRGELAQEHTDVQFMLAEPLGPHPLLMDLLLQRADEANHPIKDER
jgi:sirohydrochlorin ferrochelatase